MSDNPNKDVSPTGLRLYGYCIVYRKDGRWTIDQCDEYRNLPAHYPFLIEAEERLRFLRQRNIECRVSALIAEDTDTAEYFAENRIQSESESDSGGHDKGSPGGW